MDPVDQLAAVTLAARAITPANRVLLVGISGIDASGKSFLTAQLREHLTQLGQAVTAISADDWLNPPEICIAGDDPAAHFYKFAIRFEEMFNGIVLRLREKRDHKIDIVLLEGIFLFKRAYLRHFDVKVWIDCSFETALERAIRRRQEGLPPAETVEAFQTIYFPAQRFHLEHDDPRGTADVVVSNERQEALA